MSEPKIRRKFKALSVTIATATAGATTIRWDDVAGGTLEMGTVATAATSIQVWASDSESSAFGRLYNTDGSAADITLSASTTEARVYALPDACYGAGAIKLVAGQAAGTATTAVVTLKT